MDRKHGKLALEFANLSLENLVLKSARGYYIGTFDPERGPVSRESEEYWASEKLAAHALEAGKWTQKREP